MAAKGPTDLEYLVDKLETWYAEVTGEDLKKREEKKNDEFFVLEKKLRELVEKARSIQKTRNEEAVQEKHSAASVLRKTQALKDIFSQIDDLLDELGRIIERNRKKAAEELTVRRIKIQNNYRKVADNLRNNEKVALHENHRKKPKRKLLNEDIDFDNDSEDVEQGLFDKQDLDEEEDQALQMFEENDKKIETLLDGVLNNLDQLSKAQDDLGERIDRNKGVQNKLDKQVLKQNRRFETTNSKLKKTITNIRAPHQFCMDIILVIIFVIMLGLLYKVVFK